LTGNGSKTAKQETTRFTPEQTQKLLQFIEHTEKSGHSINKVQRKDSNTSNYTTQQGSISWILDTDATDHVTYTKEHFVSFHKIKPIFIKLPNSSTITAHFDMTVQFPQKKKLSFLMSLYSRIYFQFNICLNLDQRFELCFDFLF